MSKIKHWFLTGDLHGDYHPIENFVHNKLTTPIDESAIVILGDVGANFYCDKRDNFTKYRLNECGIRLYCVRGNHEKRPSTYPNGNYEKVYDTEVGGYVLLEAEFPNLRFFLDEGGSYNINGKNVLVVPGAYSVDKWYRIANHWGWFEDEQLNEDEMFDLADLADCIGHFDYIFAHTCPLSWEYAINDLFMSSIDQEAVDKTTEKFLDDIISHIYFHRLYFGHFHDDRDLPLEKGTMLYHEFIPLGSKLNSHRFSFALNKQVDE